MGDEERKPIKGKGGTVAANSFEIFIPLPHAPAPMIGTHDYVECTHHNILICNTFLQFRIVVAFSRAHAATYYVDRILEEMIIANMIRMSMGTDYIVD